jgi:hypothetical protein
MDFMSLLEDMLPANTDVDRVTAAANANIFFITTPPC